MPFWSIWRSTWPEEIWNRFYFRFWRFSVSFFAFSSTETWWILFNKTWIFVKILQKTLILIMTLTTWTWKSTKFQEIVYANMVKYSLLFYFYVGNCLFVWFDAFKFIRSRRNSCPICQVTKTRRTTRSFRVMTRNKSLLWSPVSSTRTKVKLQSLVLFSYIFFVIFKTCFRNRRRESHLLRYAHFDRSNSDDFEH